MTTSPHGEPCGLRIAMRSAERGVNPTVFRAPECRMVLAPPSEGGVGHDSGSRWGTATFRYLSHSAVFITSESAPPCRTGKKEGDESDPPQKRGGMRTRIAALRGVPLSGPMRVALVLIYPCGKARNRPPGGLLKSSGAGAPFPLSLDDFRSVLAVKGSLRRFAPWTAPGRSEGKRCLQGERGVVGLRVCGFRAVERAGREPFGHTGRLEPQ